MKSSGDRKPAISVPPGGSRKLYGIVVVPESCPRGKSSFTSPFRVSPPAVKKCTVPRDASNSMLPNNSPFVCSLQCRTSVSTRTEGVARTNCVCRTARAAGRVRARTTRQGLAQIPISRRRSPSKWRRRRHRVPAIRSTNKNLTIEALPRFTR